MNAGCIAVVLAGLTVAASGQPSRGGKTIDFNRPDGPYGPKEFKRDFGDFSSDNHLTEIRDRSLRVTFPKGRKIEGLRGARVHVRPARNMILEFRVMYPKETENGLHGKQFGIAGGAGYTGGRGTEARNKGDGWSVRLRFDSWKDGGLTNQLYVYHASMKGKYGEDLGTDGKRIPLRKGQWHTMRLKVTSQSSADKADGEIEVWQDGRRRIHIRNLRLAGKESALAVNEIALESFCGGAGITPTRDNHVFFDDIRWWSE